MWGEPKTDAFVQCWDNNSVCSLMSLMLNIQNLLNSTFHKI